MTDAPRLEALSSGDAPALLELSRSVGWHIDLQGWRTALSLGRLFGHRGPGGEPLSSAGLFPFGPGLASLGLVIVRPSHQGRGLGRAAVLRCLDSRSGPEQPVVLVATPQGEPLYKSLGFAVVGHAVRLARPGAPVPSPEAREEIDLFAEKGLREVARLDSEAVGADRSRLIIARLRHAPAVLKRGGAAAGFGMRTPRGEELLLGPIAAPDAGGAAALAARLLRGHAGAAQLDVPVEQEGFREALQALGFREEQPPVPIMLLGAPALPGRREKVFALASRAYV